MAWMKVWWHPGFTVMVDLCWRFGGPGGIGLQVCPASTLLVDRPALLSWSTTSCLGVWGFFRITFVELACVWEGIITGNHEYAKHYEWKIPSIMYVRATHSK